MPLPSAPQVPSSRWSKIVLRTIVVLAILAASGWGVRLIWKQVSPGLLGNQRRDVIPTAKAKQAPISEEIIAVGRLRAVFSTELRSEINGRIVKILASDGEHVVKDQDLIRLDPTDIVTQLQEMQKNIDAAKLKATRAGEDYRRYTQLEKRGIVTPKDVLDSQTNYSLAQNDVAVYEARSANLKDKLAKTTIRAPIPGTLLLRDLTEGLVVTSVMGQNGGTLLGEVADLSALMVRTNINEIDVARLKVSDVAMIRVDSIRSIQLAGSIKRISTSAAESPYDRTRFFPVDVVVDENDPRLRPGMSATVSFTLQHVDDALAVPLSAVFSTSDAMRYVFIKKDDRFEVRNVETGIADVRRVQILSGLQLGEEVALTRPLEFDGEIPVALPSAPRARPTRRTQADATPSTPATPAAVGQTQTAKANGS
jgi:RND family efflux transporter MFP subunit